jgi:hypothetical protein
VCALPPLPTAVRVVVAAQPHSTTTTTTTMPAAKKQMKKSVKVAKTAKKVSHSRI